MEMKPHAQAPYIIILKQSTSLKPVSHGKLLQYNVIETVFHVQTPTIYQHIQSYSPAILIRKHVFIL